MARLTPEHFIAHSSWRFADTLATMPHEYTLKETGDGRGTSESPEAFDWFARYVYERGEPRPYRNLPPQVKLTIGPYYYWTMGEPDDETNLINRALVSDHDRTREEMEAVVLRRAAHFLKSAGVV